ncbi:ribonuclease E/G, partial [Mycobacterium tuberculosis]
MIDGAPPSDPPEPSQHEELPDRLRVHSLARTLGTTSRRVLDALTALDGRVRSAHSTVDRVDAVRVRDLLATHLETAGVLAASVHAPEASEEPESRLMLETQETRNADVERPHYMPLFVAPQ